MKDGLRGFNAKDQVAPEAAKSLWFKNTVQLFPFSFDLYFQSDSSLLRKLGVKGFCNQAVSLNILPKNVLLVINVWPATLFQD